MKIFVLILASLLLVSGFAMAENIYVTISNGAGEIVLANAPVLTSDVDNDGAITLQDALVCAHESAYAGGAAAGLEAAQTEYGISLVKLWGEDNGGSYGYYVNDVSAYSLADVLSDGDHLYTFAYTDLETWSDTYSYFDARNIQASAGASFELTLMMQGYDAEWNVVLSPVEGAVITINGDDTEFITDAKGKVQISLADAGEYVVSAHSDSVTLVPPVCIAAIQ